MPLLMIRNDITKMQVDAIVNPANKELRPGRGTSAAIYTAAGMDDLDQACKKLKSCEVGSAVLTKGFSLPAKYVIHAVCPQWTNGSAQEKALLGSAYRSALQLAAKKKLKSVAFPLLSSGYYGWPKSDAVHAATTVISEFLLEHDMMVYLVLYDHESVEVSKKLFSEIEEYIDDHYVGERNKKFDAGSRWGNLGDWSAIDQVHDQATYYRGFSDSPYKPISSGVTSAPEMDFFAKEQSPVKPELPIPEEIPVQEKSPTQAQAPAKKEKKAKNKIEAPDFLKKLSGAKGRKLDDLMSHMDETFSQMLLRLIDERGLKDSTVYHKANIDRRLFSKIRKDANYAPTKKTVLAFAIALELTLDETKDLLMKAGFAFSNSSKFDVIVSFFIENRRYNIFEINEALFAYGQAILGE